MVPLDVILQADFVVEGVLAQVTGVGHLLRVDAFVHLERVGRLESFVANRAQVVALLGMHTLV